MDIDEPGLTDLLEESKDLHADSMRALKVEHAQILEATANPPSTGEVPPSRAVDTKTLIGLGAGLGLAGAMVAAGAGTAFASTPSDVAMLQAQQSIENLAVATYKAALGLSFIGGSTANGVIKAFVTETKSQHSQHAAAFASTIRNLGGKVQSGTDPVLQSVVNKALPGLTSPAKVVALALELEQGAAATYVRNTATYQHSVAKNLTASVMGVEAQHVTVLLAVQALLAGGLQADIALPPPSLPAAAGSVGFPNAFFPITSARPVTEGAL